MTAIDIILIIVFAVSAIAGYRKGFIAQAGSLAAIVVAIIACRVFGPAATGLIMPGSDVETGSLWHRYMASAVACSVVYLVAYYAVILIFRLLKTITHTLMLGPLDRIGGSIVNMLKWAMALSLVANLYLVFWPDGKVLKTSTLAEGRPVQWITALAPRVLGIISDAASGSNATTRQQQPAATSSSSSTSQQQ